MATILLIMWERSMGMRCCAITVNTYSVLSQVHTHTHTHTLAKIITWESVLLWDSSVGTVMFSCWAKVLKAALTGTNTVIMAVTLFIC